METTTTLAAIEVDDGQTLELGVVYRLERADMPYAVWNGEQFVGVRERFHLRLLETATRAEGGWVTRVSDGKVHGAPLVPELHIPICHTCDSEETVRCERNGHHVIEEAVPNRALMAAIEEAIAPQLEADAEARAADDADEVMLRAFKWESRHGEPYSPSQWDLSVIRRRLAQLDPNDPQAVAIQRRFPDCSPTVTE